MAVYKQGFHITDKKRTLFFVPESYYKNLFDKFHTLTIQIILYFQVDPYPKEHDPLSQI